ncbi:hypothetical protein [Bradyrhizobium sp. 2S1]|uniref:hypothetical protein n=1 Tax=Bradyrhizobium sp. 2S1 TaxID=1404429 RepID=UPI00289E89C2|nr:hypothetical protein [Bradyrhizobium sp. 2S1]
MTHIKQWRMATWYSIIWAIKRLEIHGDAQMSTQSNIHFYVNWAKERLDEMDATLTSLESKVAEVQADARDSADKVLTILRKKRDDFRNIVKKQSEPNEAAWISAQAQLETEWSSFETEARKYIESFVKQVEQQQATFKLQAAAQLNAWREAADKLGSAANEFAAERRDEIDAALKRMKADAVAAEAKLLKLNEAGTQSWSVLTAALTETRATFDRANQALREQFKRAA